MPSAFAPGFSASRLVTAAVALALSVALGVSELKAQEIPPEPPDSPPSDNGVRDTVPDDLLDQPLIWLVSTTALERARLAELTGRARGIPILLRSPGVLLTSTDTVSKSIRVLLPEIQFTHNSHLPYSVNDGAMWAGRGLSTRTIGGVAIRTGRLTLVLAPELVTTENRFFERHLPGVIDRPPTAGDRSEWQFEWYAVGPYSIDMPTRFGDAARGRLHVGQSSLAMKFGPFELGPAWENHWWGPGIGNALVLSNNAPGFAHVFFRPSRPFRSPLGDLDFRWLVGGLRESPFFDTLTTNDLRSISAAAVTLSLRRPAGLTIGAARSVWGTASGWGDVPLRWLDVFRNAGRPNARALSDSSLYPGGYDQLYSLFGRWVFPNAGLETYVEWGRTEMPTSFRDLLVAPNHTQAYTIGLQWRRPGFRTNEFWRVQAENTTVEQSATFRDRPSGVWYTSRRVVQGYTNEGQPLGAAIGPGSSGQNIAVDYFTPRVALGAKAGRMRLNEDVRSIFMTGREGSWCLHDTYLYWGGRAAFETAVGIAALDLTLGNRMNVWFQAESFNCLERRVDIRNNTISLTFSPLVRRSRSATPRPPD